MLQASNSFASINNQFKLLSKKIETHTHEYKALQTKKEELDKLSNDIQLRTKEYDVIQAEIEELKHQTQLLEKTYRNSLADEESKADLNQQLLQEVGEESVLLGENVEEVMS